MLSVDIAAIKKELDSASHGGRKPLARKIAKNLGVSVDTLYREIRNLYGVKKNVTKEPEIPDHLIDEVAKIKERLKRTGKKEREISTDLCIEHLKETGVEGAERLTSGTVNRRLREKGYRQEKAYVRVEASYANQQHQLDFSRSEYFQVKGFDRSLNDYSLQITRNTTSYKENDFKLRTWLVGITDAYSRVSLSKAYVASGESIHLGVDFLNFAYNREKDEHPLIYLPERMKMDNGSFGKSKDVKEFLNKLEIEYEFSEPNKKRGNQKRESAWKMLWRRFELKLVLKLGGNGKTIMLKDYNDMLHEFMVELLKWPHPVKNISRGHAYRTSVQMRPQRIMDEDLKKYIFKVITRTVTGDKLISLDAEKYSVPEFIPVGEEIRVYKNLSGEVVGELINNPRGQKPFLIPPSAGFVTLDDFSHRAHNTYKDEIVNKVLEEDREKKEAEKKDKINYMPVREKKVKPRTVFNEAQIDESHVFPSVYDAKVYISKQLKKTESYEDYAYIFDDMLEEDRSKKAIDYVLSTINNRKAING
jgi:hypothetical protein